MRSKRIYLELTRSLIYRVFCKYHQWKLRTLRIYAITLFSFVLLLFCSFFWVPFLFPFLSYPIFFFTFFLHYPSPSLLCIFSFSSAIDLLQLMQKKKKISITKPKKKENKNKERKKNKMKK